MKSFHGIVILLLLSVPCYSTIHYRSRYSSNDNGSFPWSGKTNIINVNALHSRTRGKSQQQPQTTFSPTPQNKNSTTSSRNNFKSYIFIGGTSAIATTSAIAASFPEKIKPFIQNRLTGLRTALAGGIGGAAGTFILYPIDTAKTLRQADPKRYTSVSLALKDLLWGVAGDSHSLGLQEAYSGVLSATFLAIPSSALYFGAYETAKNVLTKTYRRRHPNEDGQPVIPTPNYRLCIHAVSAACGNTLSSLIFVPKEYIKQRMQAYGSGKFVLSGYNGKITVGNVIRDTIEKNGIRGMYSGYVSTLMRNIPSAVLRFALYEELKLRLLSKNEDDGGWTEAKAYAGGGFSPLFFISGALAGAAASGFMTPMDVIKTRISTGTIPPECITFPKSLHWIVQEYGVQGLYAGARARMVWSGAFSAIGFGTFEIAKKCLGVGAHQISKEMKQKDPSAI